MKKLHKLAIVPIVALTVAAASSCGSNSAADAVGDIQDAALLDYANAQITLPLDAFGMTVHEERLVIFARVIALNECLVEQEIAEYTPVSHESFHAVMDRPLLPDWRYAHWNADLVAQHGILGQQGAEPPEDFSVTISSVGNDRAHILDECADNVGFEPIARSQVHDESFFLASGFWQSLDAARGDSLWRDTAGEWDQCVQESGFQVSPNDEFGVDIGEAHWESEEALLAFVAAAQCSDSLGTISTLANLEAQFQADFIAENFATLNEIHVRGQEIVAEARDFLTERGFPVG